MAPRGAYTDSSGRVAMRDPESGDQYWVPKSKLQEAVDHGMVGVTPDEHRASELAKKYDDPASALGYAALRGATLGLSDAAMTAVNPSMREHLRLMKKHNPVASGVGDVGGAILSAVIPGAPLARVGGLGTKIALRAGRGKGAQAVARGALEGAGMGAGSAVSKGALTGDYSGTDIAKHAAYGAAVGGALSLAGHGIMATGRALARRAAAKSQARKLAALSELEGAQALSRGLKADSKQLAKLLSEPAVGEPVLALMNKIRVAGANALDDVASKAEVMRRLSPWAPKTGTKPWMLEQAVADVQATISKSRRAAFAQSGGALQKVSGPLGVVVGVATESVLLGGVGFGAAMAGGGVARRLAGSGLRRSGRAIVKGAIGSAKTAARATTKVMSQAEVGEVADAVKDIDPATLRADAMAGYAEAGVEPEAAQQLADFQTQRLVMYQLEAPQAAEGGYGARAKFTRLHAALSDPRSIVKRAEQMKWTTEDQEVLAKFFPRHHDLLMDEWQRELDEGKDKLPWARRNYLKNKLDPMRASRIAVASAELYSMEPEKAPSSPKSSKFPTGAGPLDRISAQAGLYGGKKA